MLESKGGRGGHPRPLGGSLPTCAMGAHSLGAKCCAGHRAVGHRPRGGAGASVRGMLESSVVKRKNVSILFVGLLSNGFPRKTFIDASCENFPFYPSVSDRLEREGRSRQMPWLLLTLTSTALWHLVHRRKGQ